MENTTETVHTFIREYVEEHGFPPSQREIAAGCYLSQPAVLRHLDRLQVRGHIQREPGRARSIRLLNGKRGEK